MGGTDTWIAALLRSDSTVGPEQWQQP